MIIAQQIRAVGKNWEQIIITHSFRIPSQKKNVYVVPDVPHLLKLTRNWLVDHGFKYKEKNITLEPLKKILEGRMAEAGLVVQSSTRTT